MGNHAPGSRPNFNIPTRQKADLLFNADGQSTIAAGASTQFDVRKVLGYGSIRFLASSGVTFRIRVQEARTKTGPWVETARYTSSLSNTGQQHICVEHMPCGSFMRIFVDNTSASNGAVTLDGTGLPIAPGSGSGGGNGSGNCNIGDQITTAADVSVGVGATVALTVPPLGTLRMTVVVTDGDDTTIIRVREVGGVDGRPLNLLGSTTFGGKCGAIAALEVENVAGPSSAVNISFERE